MDIKETLPALKWIFFRLQQQRQQQQQQQRQQLAATGIFGVPDVRRPTHRIDVRKCLLEATER
jgi:hypothetical protein